MPKPIPSCRQSRRGLAGDGVSPLPQVLPPDGVHLVMQLSYSQISLSPLRQFPSNLQKKILIISSYMQDLTIG